MKLRPEAGGLWGLSFQKICTPIIGSFRQHYELILQAVNFFKKCGIVVLSPLGSNIIEAGIGFVRFTSDLREKTDEIIQAITLTKLFLSTAVYVVAPQGYVGRTTCYEIGRIIQIRKPLYFSEHPLDLPIRIPTSHVVTAEQLSAKIISNSVTWPFAENADEYSRRENELFDMTRNNNIE